MLTCLVMTKVSTLFASAALPVLATPRSTNGASKMVWLLFRKNFLRVVAPVECHCFCSGSNVLESSGRMTVVCLVLNDCGVSGAYTVRKEKFNSHVALGFHTGLRP